MLDGGTNERHKHIHTHPHTHHSLAFSQLSHRIHVQHVYSDTSERLLMAHNIK